jgi:hypothetical protein
VPQIDTDGWTPVQSWALSLRRAGKSALFIHHGGKSGAQRGTSRKEDVLDAVISLRRPPDYLPEQGAASRCISKSPEASMGRMPSPSRRGSSGISGR